MLAWIAALVGLFVPPPDAAVAARVQAPWSQEDLGARVAFVTEPFLGAPYRLSALGEGDDGDGVDRDPRMRFDAFDCTTFVETAMALSLASNLQEARQLLDAIRYRDGSVAYLARRHFPEAEWIPELTRLGLLQDITREVGGGDVVTTKKHLDASVWRRARHRGLPALPDDRIPAGDFVLDILPLERLLGHQHEIPPGTILHIVREDYASVPVRVSHQGIVIKKGGALFVRHAADRMYHSVVDEELERFVRRLQAYRKWPVAGVHLTKMQTAAAWRRQVLVSPKPTTPAPTPTPTPPQTPTTPAR